MTRAPGLLPATGREREACMMTMPAIIADELGKHIASDFRRLFGSLHQDKAERPDAAARMALEGLGKSDVLYHNVEHTFLAILVGRDILHGRILRERLEPDDYSHLIFACLLHDIGCIRGILKGDGMGRFVVDGSGATCSSLSSSFAAKRRPRHEAGCHQRTTGISLGEPA
jgi:hypothetical protein